MISSMTLPTRQLHQTKEDGSNLDPNDKSLSQPNVAALESILSTGTNVLTPPPTPRSTDNDDIDGNSTIIDNGNSNKLDTHIKKDSKESSSVQRIHNSSSSTSDLSPILENQEKELKKPATSSQSGTVKSLMSASILMNASIINSSKKLPESKRDKDVLSVQSMDIETGLNTSFTSLNTPDNTSDDLSVDIDTALEEVMAGLKSLEMQQKQDKRMSLPAVKVKQTPKHTPDLVLDLPDGNGSNSSTDLAEPDSPTSISAAETFAQSNQGTLKKMSVIGESHNSGQSAGISDETKSRLSVSSEPGDLARTSDSLAFSRGMHSSQPPLSTFSLKRTQSARPVGDKESSLTSTKIGPPYSSGSSFTPSSFMVQIPAPAPTPPIFIPPVPKTHVSSGLSVGQVVPPPIPPPVAQKPKPPMKVKPAVMKKPATPPRAEVNPPP